MSIPTVLIGNKLLTPNLDSGALPGITRELILEWGLAQEAELNFDDLAKKDTYKLVKLLQLDQQMAKDLNGLFLYKYNQFSLAKNENEKKQISEQIEAKLRATLTPSQMDKITSQPDLLKSLIN
mgnify:CR=1 FL=1